MVLALLLLAAACDADEDASGSSAGTESDIEESAAGTGSGGVQTESGTSAATGLSNSEISGGQSAGASGRTAPETESGVPSGATPIASSSSPSVSESVSETDSAAPATASPTPVLEAPVVTASRNRADAVALSWTTSEAAVAWNVYVGEDRLNDEPLDAPTFTDEGAPAAPPVGPPADLRATDTVEEEVQLTWGDVESMVGATVTYVVEAIAADGATLRSEPVDGWRISGPVEAWEIHFDDQIVLLPAEPTNWADTTLEPGAPPTPEPQLTDLGPLGVELTATFTDLAAPTRSYRVAARTASGLGALAGPVTGSRPVGPWELRWYSGESELVVQSPARRTLVGSRTPLRDRNPLEEGVERWYLPQTERLDGPGATSGEAIALVGRAALLSSCRAASDCASGQCAAQGFCAPMPLADTDHPMPMAFVPAGDVILEPGGAATGVYVEGSTAAPARITRGYFVTETLLTRGQFRSLFPETPIPPNVENCEASDCPIGLAAIEIAGFANALSAREGLTQCYTGFSPEGCDPMDRSEEPCSVFNVELAEDCDGYRLGSGVEWMRAAWGNTTGLEPCTPFPTCLDDIVWWSGNSDDEGQRVAQKPAGPWGIFDMLGNYAERVHHRGATGAAAIPAPVPDDYLQTSRMNESFAAMGGRANSNADAFRRSRGLPFNPNLSYSFARDTRAGVRLFRTAPQQNP